MRGNKKHVQHIIIIILWQIESRECIETNYIKRIRKNKGEEEEEEEAKVGAKESNEGIGFRSRWMAVYAHILSCFYALT